MEKIYKEEMSDEQHLRGLYKFPKKHILCFYPSRYIYMFKVNNGKKKTMCETYPKLPIKSLEWRQWRRSGVLFIVNFEQISHIVLIFP